MSKHLQKRFLIILAVVIASLVFTFPIKKRINLGLDLQGGMHLVLRIENEKMATESARNDAVLRAIEILRNRIDSLGVGETVIQRQGDNQLLVQLPGITDRERALSIINRVAHLEFKLVSDDQEKFRQALQGNVPEGFELKTVKGEGHQVLLESEAVLGGDTITDARVDFDRTGVQPKISLTFNAKGAREFGRLTTDNVGRQLAIVLDGEVLSAPNIREPILSGQAEITGQYSFEEASTLSLALRSGALPAAIKIEEERTVGPLLGKDSIDAGVRASVFGLIFIFVFMSIYYMVGGVIACVALLVNLIMILGSMGLINILLPESHVTLTLPGIAGVILTLGMAVDANVLINERIREELSIGRPLMAAVNAGFSRAFSAIIDCHVTTLIASFFLFEFGSGPIKGFAVTLALGLIASLFTALYVSKSFFMFLLENKFVNHLPMLHLFGKTTIDFLGKRFFGYVFSIVIVTVGLVSFVSKKEAVYGIDFAGGQMQEYRFAKPISAEEVREALKKANAGEAIIQQDKQNSADVMVRTSGDTYEAVSKSFKDNIKDNTFQVLRIEKVGPVVGKALRKHAVLAIVFALAAMLVFIGFRFKHFDFAAAGVVALLYDVLVALGMIVFLGRQVDLLVVTALLTIAGYSINDTVVLYDRVRENWAKSRKINLAELINTSVNQTLSRTVLTTGVTLLVVLALYLFGGEVLNTFSLCLLIGFASGVYSTIFIASPLVLVFNRFVK